MAERQAGYLDGGGVLQDIEAVYIKQKRAFAVRTETGDKQRESLLEGRTET